jgi:hypothetical protein
MICNKCLKELSSKYYLKKHIEKCKGVFKEITDEDENKDLIIYDLENNKINFDLKHLNYDFIHKLVTINDMDAFEYFINKLFENKNNQMIRKRNLKDKYTEIYIGSNRWLNKLNQELYDIIIGSISDAMLLYINDFSANYNKKQIENLEDFLQIMKNNGKSDDYKGFYKDKYKENKKMLKKLFNSFL